jgi:glycosyltransferase involved in cell wall biosynthesis
VRILAITHNFPNEGNWNHGVFAARQFVEMQNQGSEIKVLVPAVWAPALIRIFRRWRKYNHTWKHEYKGIKGIVSPFLRLPGVWFNSWQNRLAYFALRSKAIELHRSQPFDIIYARFLFPDGYAAMRLSEALHIPAVAVAAGSDINFQAVSTGRMNRDFLNMLDKLDGFVTSGQQSAEKIDELCGRRPLSLHGVVDMEQFCPAPDKSARKKELGIDTGKLVVLYVGSFQKIKGVYVMMQAFLKVHKNIPQSVMKICGYGDERENMEAFIRDAGADDSIQIVGPVDSDRVHLWMQAADVFVLSSYSEGMPNTVMEAMSCGLPTVATAVGGLPYELKDCLGAILVKPREVDELAHAVEKVLSENELRRKMEIAAREKALQSFSVRSNTRTLLKYLSDIKEKYRDKHQS